MNTGNRKQNPLLGIFILLKQQMIVYTIILLMQSLFKAIERPFMAYILKNLTDSITQGSVNQLGKLLIIWLIFIVTWMPVYYLIIYSWNQTIVRIIASLRNKLFSHLQYLPLSYHEKRHSGDILSVITNDVDATAQAFRGTIHDTVTESIAGISAFIYMFVLNWKLALIIIICNILFLKINFIFAKISGKIETIKRKKTGKASERLSDLLAGYQVIRSYNLRTWIMRHFNKANRVLLRNNIRGVKLNSVYMGVLMLRWGLNRIFPAAVIIFLVLKGKATLGTFMAYMIMIDSIERIISRFGNYITGIQGSFAAAGRVMEIFDTDPEPVSYKKLTDLPKQSPKSGMLLEFSNVSFSYEQDRNILHGMSFEVPEGKVIAFVGPSGGGKSTLFKLLLGCYPVFNGSVFVKGKPVNEYQLDDLRDLFTYIPQDSYLFSGSIMENIRYGGLNASDEEAIQAAKAAYAHDFILGFPSGYESEVGERGVRLSGGERQRIAIARALLKDAQIILLDEATSSLDSESEELVQQALHSLMKGHTALIIAHRLSTIEHADIIYAIDNGKVIESGNHRELLEKKGLYSRLYEIQFRDEKQPELIFD